LIILTTLKVKERPEFTVVDKPLPLLKSIRYTLTNRSFVVLVSANFMSILMNSLILGAIFYLADYVVKMNTIALLAFLFIPLIIGVPLTTLIRGRFGVVRAQQILMTVAGVGLILVAVLPSAFIPACIGLAGLGLAGPQTLTNVLFAQVADEDEVRSGVRREGSFFGVNALVTKPAQSLALSLSPIILQATRFVSRSANGGVIFLDQPASALFGIKVIAGLIPGIAMLMGALILFLFPLHGEYLNKIQAQVLELHAQKHAQLEAQQDEQRSVEEQPA
jgi:GPH family glycoside/pentoside/hexuronide:cation symporter